MSNTGRLPGCPTSTRCPRTCSCPTTI